MNKKRNVVAFFSTREARVVEFEVPQEVLPEEDRPFRTKFYGSPEELVQHLVNHINKMRVDLPSDAELGAMKPLDLT